PKPTFTASDNLAVTRAHKMECLVAWSMYKEGVYMLKSTHLVSGLSMLIAMAAAGCRQGNRETTGSKALDVSHMTRVGTIDERYQSYNVEMLEVTGGKFWKPYGPELESLLKQPPPAANASAGDDT